MNRLTLACGLLAAAPVHAQLGPPVVDTLPLEVDDEYDSPSYAAMSPDGTLILVAHEATDNVTFYDVAARRVLSAVDVGDRPVHIEFAQDAGVAIVTNYGSASITLIDVPTRAVTNTVSVSNVNPTGTRAFADASFAVVAQTGPGPGTSSMSLVDLAQGLEVSTFPTVQQVDGSNPSPFELATGDTRVVLADSSFSQLVVYDIATGIPLFGIQLAGEAYDSEVDFSGGRIAFAVNAAGADLMRLDRVTLQATALDSGATLFPFGVRRMALSPDGSRAILPGSPGGVVDLTTGVGQALPVDCYQACIAFDNARALVLDPYPRVVDLVSLTASPWIGRFDVETSAVGAFCLSSLTSQAGVVVSAGRERIREIDLVAAAKVSDVSTSSGVDLDAPAGAGLLPDGERAVVVCGDSRNVAVIDLAQRAVLATSELTGDPRSWAIPSTGDAVLVAQYEPSELAWLDLATGNVTASAPLLGVGGPLVLSPDGSEAYMADFDLGFGSLTLRRYQVDPGVVALVASLAIPIPSIGSPELAVSPDGATLAVSGGGGTSVVGDLVLVDTASWSVLQTFAGGFDGYAGVVFDGPGRLFAGHVTGLHEFSITGGSATFVGSVGPPARGLALDMATRRILVRTPGGVYVYDLASGTASPEVPAATWCPGCAPVFTGTHAFLAHPNFLVHLDETWPVPSVESSNSFGWYASAQHLVFSPRTGIATLARPELDDLVLFDFGDLPTTNYCAQPVANSQGQFATIEAAGVFFAGGGGALTLTARDLPPGQPGYFLASRTQGLISNPGGSLGDLCVTGSIVRFAQQVQWASVAGEFSIDVDTLGLPTAPASAIQSGETWNFQAWYRDLNPGPTSTFTDAVSVPFR